MPSPALKRNLLIASSLLVLVLLLVTTAGGGAPRRAVSGALRPFLSAGHVLRSLVRRGAGVLHVSGDSNRDRIRKLEARVIDLQLELVRAESLAGENRELRNMLALPQAPSWRHIAAPVIARDPLAWNRRFRIGKGQADGIVLGAVVLAGSSVIGRVTELGGRSAMVTTLADPACRLSVRIRGAEAVGTLVGGQEGTWQRPPRCVVDYLPRDAVYRVGQVVETSGLGGAVAPGLRVGRLESWSEGQVVQVQKTTYARGVLCPDASFGDVGLVAVVTRWNSP